MRVNLAELRAISRDSKGLTDKIKSILAECPPDEPPFLSDLIVEFQSGGIYIMRALEEHYNRCLNLNPEQRIAEMFRWRLHCLRDKWGNPVLPGDVVEFREQLPLEHSPGRPVTSRELNIDKANGRYNDKWTRLHKYTADERGCITCEFLHAARFLNLWGIHSVSKAIISKHKNPHSAGPQETPKPGEKLHAWYHRFEEVDRAQYEALPILKPRPEGEKKRGEK